MLKIKSYEQPLLYESNENFKHYDVIYSLITISCEFC